MVKQQPITASQQLGLKAVHCKQLNPSWSNCKIGKHVGCSHHFVKRWVTRHQQSQHVSDKPRSGRPQKADADAEQHIYMAAQLPECTSAADIAANTERALGSKFSSSTVTRLLRKQGLQHLRARIVPMLKACHKVDRVTFARKALRREVCSWLRTMITDSKYFKLQTMGRPAARWCTQATRGTVARPKHCIGVHVYMGICYHGTTTLKFVTGTHKQVSQNAACFRRKRRLHRQMTKCSFLKGPIMTLHCAVLSTIFWSELPHYHAWQHLAYDHMHMTTGFEDDVDCACELCKPIGHAVVPHAITIHVSKGAWNMQVIGSGDFGKNDFNEFCNMYASWANSLLQLSS